MYFEALASGGGDDWYNVILLTATNGVTVTVSDGDEEIEIVGTGLQQAVTIHNENATYTISATMNGLTKSAASITTDSTSGKLFIRELKMAAIEVTFDDDFRGLDYTISDGTTTSTTQVFPGAPDNTVNIFVPNTGMWKVSSTVGSDTFESQGANVTDLDSSYTDSIHVIPDGKTVTPVNDIQIWLACANIKNKPYTKLEEVLADENTLRRLLTDDNAIDYLKRSTDWKSGKNLIPIMTSINTPSGLCFASSLYSASQNQIYYAFNDYEQDEVGGGNDKRWFPSSYSGDQYLGYIFDNPVLFKYIRLRHSSYNITGIKFKIQGSNNTTTGADGTWTDLTSEINFDYSQPGGTTGYINQIVDVSSNSTAYKAYRILYTTNIYNDGGSGYICQTVKFFTIIGEGITDSELAMSYIGAYDYAADTLLADSDWAPAIIGSEYWNDVCNVSVPTMTSDTTPEGAASAESVHSNGNYPAWKAFNPTEAYGWHPATTGSHPNPWIQYEFTEKEPVSVVRIKVATALGSVHASSIILKGSNDGFVSDTHTIQTLETGWNSSIFTDWKDYIISNTDEYKYYRIEFNGEDRLDYDQGIKLQFLGREAGGVQSWLKAAGLSKPYTALDEVIADSDALATLVTNHDAVDYLVTAKVLIDGITSSAKAMRYIGYRNYCADTLLADEDWCEGIANSEYFESVLNTRIPAKTADDSNIIFSSEISDGRKAYKAFDDDWNKTIDHSSGYDYWYATSGTNQWLGYDFGTPVDVKYFKIRGVNYNNGTGLSLYNFKLQYSDVGGNNDSDWYDATSQLRADSTQVYNDVMPNVGAHRYWRLYEIQTNLPSGQYCGAKNLQFLARADVDETILYIYSAASDSNIHLMQGGSPVNVGSTDTTGHGTISRSVLPNGEYELYSSVAKDPDNLSDDYHKTVKVTDDTIEINLMPENALYWYGWMSDNCESTTDANGWSIQTVTQTDPVYETNRVNITASGNYVTGVGTKNAVELTDAHAILSVYDITNGDIRFTPAKSNKDDIFMISPTTSNVIQHITGNTTRQTGYLAVRDYRVSGGAANTGYLYALWYE